MNLTSFKTALQETLRTTIISVIPILIMQIEAQTLDWRAPAIALAIGLLRGLDKYLHTEGRTTGLEMDFIKD